MAPRESVGSLPANSESRSRVIRTGNPQKTPFTKSRVSLHQLRKNGKNTEALKVLGNLSKKAWFPFSVSPLFTWSNRKLKRYSRRMAYFLAENLAIEDGRTLEVIYQIDEELKLHTNDDPAVKITVNLLEENHSKPVFLGYLISWGCPKAAKPEELDGVVYLPVLLCSGSKKVGLQVRRALERIHDCVISSLELLESDRKELWMALLAYLQHEDVPLTISYTIPNRRNVGTLDLDISSALTTKLFTVIKKKHRNMSFDDVARFWNDINECVYENFGIFVRRCEMAKLRLKDATVAADKFRADTTKALHVILIFLSDISAKLESPTNGMDKR